MSLKTGLLQGVRMSGLTALTRRLTRGCFRIVTYHGVQACDDPVLNYDALQTDPAVFRSHLELYGKYFDVRPLDELTATVVAGERPPPGALAITFDDGYLNNAEVAAPLLEAFGFPATFFLTSGFVCGTHRPWWYDLRSLLARAPDGVDLPGFGPVNWPDTKERGHTASILEQRLAPLSEDERKMRLGEMAEGCGLSWPGSPAFPFMTPAHITGLAADGFSFGAHGVSHASLSAEPEERVRGEVVQSVAAVREWAGRCSSVFCYPYGHIPSNLESWSPLLGENGLTAGVTVQMGGNGRETPPYQLRRFDMHGNRDALNVEVLLAMMGRGFS